MQPRIQAIFLVVLSILSGTASWTSTWRSPFHQRSLFALSAEGFAKKTSSSIPNESKNPIYSQPALYDLAFGYRDFEEEVEFLWQRHVDVTGQQPERTLEVAAGPARHSLTALVVHNDVLETTYCVDASKDMLEYASDIAEHELSVDEQKKFHYQVADMRNFSLPESVDTAWILLGSLQHMNTNNDVRQCLNSINKCLVPGGTLVIELPHPRETFSMVECTRNGWKVPLEDGEGEGAGELAIIWGDDDDEFDPITQVRQFTVRMALQGTEDDKIVKEVVPLRLFTAQEVEALAAASNFRVASLHGALEEGVKANDEDAAYRLVVVLQKL
eukprot:scaffold568_cov160-Amphora_coffeaeformis.AAC.13